ncbi:hypothetical protein EU99_0605 [Prochlorococcus marinus str. MIT 9321]|uniref:Uncharacterized protein n=1 Tax=Prochlorococcus marinus str. MIT 9401 TaxID=167551 RepID=A0A0A2B2E3_PROMR|nr:hypothetical protein EU99_0605 [Prochlorococcus marinus str. MIT 9321]KGG06820.1 hypothetical protein EV00_0076 [Prochlorococcus marinus str. MIT 9322]KGG06955.1 hypothetical protein EV01_1287 [Prochlorococcus marinus str. MIT 9401]
MIATSQKIIIRARIEIALKKRENEFKEPLSVFNSSFII